ncbi:NADAR family protein [Pseudomonas huanghezhanensis]|uniref:NADAR family protein n=1 Tax=Pseudomonas huanghezhanensis TaxID=3002903 RepID=UPI00228635C5|nr:NADAR family protein [Pseudomonas sp. BSw22131]
MLSKKNMTLFFSEKDEFSNWYISAFEVEGIRFNCVEQFMMYRKAVLFGNPITAAKIMNTSNPKAQKALGRGVVGFKDEVWLQCRSEIVVTGCYAKFSQDLRLRRVLLATRKSTLVEASPYDRIWGVGLSGSDPRIFDPRKWRGKNLLGNALMQVRERLMNDRSSN